jgi:membrane protease YdiL (CAAX protease family)
MHPGGLPAPPQEPAPTGPPQHGTPTVPRVEGREGWRPWTAVAAIVAGFSVTIMGGIAVAVVTAALGGDIEDPPAGVNIGLTLFQNLALVGAAVFFALLAGRPSGADFGLQRARFWRSARLMAAALFGFYAFSLIWGTLLNLDEEQTLPEELGVGGSDLNLVLVTVLITVVAPLGEEIFFRGYFFSALRNWRGWLPAAIITGLVFGAIHIGSSPIGFTVPLAFFGFLLCVLYQRTGSLYPCIALHALNNSLAFGLTQDWTWEILPVAVGAVAVALTIARLFGGALGARAPNSPAPIT